MLVITRKNGEAVSIGNDIRITVVAVIGGKVRLGIEAPRDVPVVRDDAKSREAQA